MKSNRRRFIKNTSISLAGISVYSGIPAFNCSDITKKLDLEIYATNWGFKGNIEDFCRKAQAAGYDGIEVWSPGEASDRQTLRKTVDKYQLKLGLLAGNWGGSVEEHLNSFRESLSGALELEPEFVNCHSGKDFFSLEENAPFLDFAEEQHRIKGIPIYHETHRGRMLFSAPATKNFMDKHQELRLTLDISHWCCVHESYLEDQKPTIDQALSRVDHIHSRIGFAEGPQIPNHDDPQYQKAIDAHFAWWDEVVRMKKESGEKLTMTTEFGPPPYMWTSPYTGEPLADVWDVNTAMKDVWIKRYRG